MREARRLGSESAEDFASSYLLECLKSRRSGSHDAGVASLRTLNTVRRRLVRQAQKFRQAREFALSKTLAGRGPPRPRDELEIAEFTEALRDVFSMLGAREKVLLDGMLQGKSLKESALRAGMDYDAARQAASRLKKKVGLWLYRFRELAQG
jgi:hypothetical protein